ncbi:MAG: hypothetical protein ABIT71_23925 [Vicinamibacteraceae bacterium]
MPVLPERSPALIRIKLLHTAVWFVVAACIVAIPIAGARGQYAWAAAMTGVVLTECIVLAANQGRCPLTGLAARYTEQRAANFDIYLPLWLARRNKPIFGTLFVAGGLFVLARWFTR